MLVLGGALFVRVIDLTLYQPYGLDEFQYSHGGWLLAQGEMIYRDFFEHHFPLLHQFLGLLWLGLDDDPNNILLLRLAMLPGLLLACAAATVVNLRACRRWAVVTVPVLLMIPPYILMATQIRPDPLAAALYLGALAVLATGARRPRVHAALAGVLVGLALWTTIKVVLYGLPIVAALVADLARRLRPGDERRYLLRDPIAFLVGAGAVGVAIVGYLTATGSWAAFWQWAILFNVDHQRVYPGFPWLRNVAQLLRTSFWLLPFAIIGIVYTIRRLGAARASENATDDDPATDTDWLLLGSLITTFGSFVWQTAPYLYSLVPFMLILAVFTARGVVITVEHLARWRAPVFTLALLALVLGAEAGQSFAAIDRLIAQDNSLQHERWRRVAAMTTPDQPVFHLFGGQVARPSVHFFYFVEAATMQLFPERLIREIPQAVRDQGATVYLHADHFWQLPAPVRHFFLRNFQPAERELWVWGREYVVGDDATDPAFTDTFEAIRPGNYFVAPPGALGQGQLTVGNQLINNSVFYLDKGEHPVRYTGAPTRFFLVWLPEDGVPFVPQPEARAGLRLE